MKSLIINRIRRAALRRDFVLVELLSQQLETLEVRPALEQPLRGGYESLEARG